MAGGDVAAEIVESPITDAKIESAMSAVRTTLKISNPITITSFNQGRSLIVSGTIEA